MWRIYGGAVLVITGIAAFIEASSHAPGVRCARSGGDECGRSIHVGLSQTAYDLLRIGACALVILGAVTIIVGLVRLWQRPRSTA
jgi:hypothetical protein